MLVPHLELQKSMSCLLPSPLQQGKLQVTECFSKASRRLESGSDCGACVMTLPESELECEFCCSSAAVVRSGYDSCGYFSALEGALCRSVIMPGFKGWLPNFLNPLKILRGINAQGQAVAKSEAKFSLMITLPGSAPMNCLHAWLKELFSDLNMPTSKGCNR